jgi:hypothetical protein
MQIDTQDLTDYSIKLRITSRRVPLSTRIYKSKSISDKKVAFLAQSWINSTTEK